MELPKNKKIYFAFIPGLPDSEASLVREKHFVSRLEEVRKDAAAIYLLWDPFDFWIEYKTVVPKGFVRVLGKLAELDSGIPITFFYRQSRLVDEDYFQRIEHKRVPSTNHPHYWNHPFFNWSCDGLGPGDKGYKLMKKLFTNPFRSGSFAGCIPIWESDWVNIYPKRIN